MLTLEELAYLNWDAYAALTPWFAPGNGSFDDDRNEVLRLGLTTMLAHELVAAVPPSGFQYVPEFIAVAKLITAATVRAVVASASTDDQARVWLMIVGASGTAVLELLGERVLLVVPVEDAGRAVSAVVTAAEHCLAPRGESEAATVMTRGADREPGLLIARRGHRLSVGTRRPDAEWAEQPDKTVDTGADGLTMLTDWLLDQMHGEEPAGRRP